MMGPSLCGATLSSALDSARGAATVQRPAATAETTDYYWSIAKVVAGWRLVQPEGLPKRVAGTLACHGWLSGATLGCENAGGVSV